MKTKLLLIVLSMFLTLGVFAQPKKVIYVTNVGAANQYDTDWITMFVNQGYDASLFDQTDFNQEKLDFINSAAEPDIVIIGRPTDSGNFGTKDGVDYDEFWNAITKPMIVMNPYCVRIQRLNWLPTEDGIIQGGVFNPDGPLIDEVFFPEDPLFEGIDLNAVSLELNPSATETFYIGASSYTAYVPIDLEDFTNAKGLFTNNEGSVALMRFAKGTPTFPAQGSIAEGNTPAGDRTYFPVGSGSGGSNYGPPTALGIQLLTNEMELLLSGSLSITSFDKQNDINVYSNFALSELVIRKSNGMDTVEIFNLTGQKVKSIVNIATSETSVDVSNLVTGIYIIKVDNTYNKKFVVR